jgi:hypothetical protein
MLLKKIAVVTAVLALTALFVSVGASTTMSVTLEDGREVILQPTDSTWSFARGSLNPPQHDQFITLRDNRILWLKTDFTWTFTRTQPRPNRPTNFPSVTVTGVGSNPALDGAVNAATNDAYNKIAAQLRRLAPAGRRAQDFLMACIRDDVKEHDFELSYNPGWRAEAKVNLPSHRVQRIMDCLHLQLEQ